MAEKNCNDEILLGRFLNGDPDACQAVESGIRHIIFRWSAPFSREDKEDLVQQVLMDIYLAVAKPDFTLKHGLIALARRIAVRRCIDQMRKYRPTYPISEFQASKYPSPYDDLELNDEISRMRFALDSLNISDKEAIRRSYLKEESYAEIVDAMGRNENHWRGRVWHGMRKMRKMLGAEK